MLLPIKVKVALAGVAVAGGATIAALLGPAGPAVGQSSPPIQLQVQVNSPATLVARGAEVEVSVTGNCSGQSVESGSVQVNLTEKVGKAVATGSGGAQFVCNGTPQTVLVSVTAQPGKAFKNGVAIAATLDQACTADFSNCVTQQPEPTTIQLG